MFANLARVSVGVLALLNACSATAATYPFTVYRGTFIHLPRLNSTSDKPELDRNQGVLWVSSADGRIKGYDWSVNDDASFQSFLSSHGWTDGTSTSKGTQVQVVESNDARNEFFFPGFIGRLYLFHSSFGTADLLYRHPYPCTTVPQHWPFRLIGTIGLVKRIHLSHGGKLRFQVGSQQPTDRPQRHTSRGTACLR